MFHVEHERSVPLGRMARRAAHYGSPTTGARLWREAAVDHLLTALERTDALEQRLLRRNSHRSGVRRRGEAILIGDEESELTSLKPSAPKA